MDPKNINILHRARPREFTYRVNPSLNQALFSYWSVKQSCGYIRLYTKVGKHKLMQDAAPGGDRWKLETPECGVGTGYGVRVGINQNTPKRKKKKD